ncbi:unnamed protein product [Ilex paraguariensis]|uniref:Tyrosinase copper-binding domain-containing protein n=1 Tax=Ilex paraguariensis TaxID=185542 RepID=A0ABC8RJ10_9AQUA
MASLPTAGTATVYSPFFFNTPSTFSLSPCQFFPKTPRFLSHEKPKRRTVVSCKAIGGDQNPTTNPQNGETSPGKFDRRNVLLGLGGLYSASNLVIPPLTFANPVSVPDLSSCSDASLPAGVTPTNCCPPSATKVIDFELPSSPVMRTRPAAHLVDKEYIAKYSKAIELMKALPEDDPRNFMQQANVHCAYCDSAYEQEGFPEEKVDVHFSWIFFPFHRFYLYFFEKILGKLINDPTFALPFWNYDSPDGMTIPTMFTDTNSSLYDPLRDALHQPPTIMDLNYFGPSTETTQNDQQQISYNLTTMYKQMVSCSKNAELFFGQAYRAGDDQPNGAGAIENIPHTPVHIWTGDRNQPNGENMGRFYSAGRDPIFYCHHANVDRLWNIWKTLGGKRRDPTDKDWLNASFVFYNENAQLVRVKIKDSVDTTKLGYTYQDVPIQWQKAKPTPRNTKVAGKLSKAGVAIAPEIPPASEVFPTVLDRVVKAMVKRPKKKRSKKDKEEEEEVLVVDGIELEKDVYSKFDVFINDDEESECSPDKTEFAGSFAHIPMKLAPGKKRNLSLRFGITELLEDLGVEDDDSLLVTLLPKAATGLVTIGGVKIEFSA